MAAVPLAVLAGRVSLFLPSRLAMLGLFQQAMGSAGWVPEARSRVALLGLSSPFPAGFIVVGTGWALDVEGRRGAGGPSAAARSPCSSRQQAGVRCWPQRAGCWVARGHVLQWRCS